MKELDFGIEATKNFINEEDKMQYFSFVVRHTGSIFSSPCYDPGTLTAAAILVSGAAATTASVHQSNMARKSAKSAAEAQVSREKAAAENLKQAQETASSRAQAIVDKKRRVLSRAGNTIVTSPLGIAGQATTAKKRLLGA
jgi:hypothetical protein